MKQTIGGDEGGQSYVLSSRMSRDDKVGLVLAD